jgi:hypothetical protein
MPTDSSWLVLLLVVALLWWAWIWRRQPSTLQRVIVPARVQRLLKPRTPDDCPACCLPLTTATGTTLTPAPSDTLV